MSKKIIVPKGLVNPDDTTIIEIPEDLKDEPQLIASPRPARCPGPQQQQQQQFQPQHTSTPKTYTHITRTVIEHPSSGNDSSLGLLGSGYMDSSRSHNRGCSSSCPSRQASAGALGPGYNNRSSTLGQLGPGYFDSTRSTNQSLGILGSGYMDSTRNTNQSLGILGSGYMDSTRNTNQSLGILGSGYMDSTRGTNDTSLGLLHSGYMDNSRSTNQSSLGILKSGCVDSSNNSSPRIIKKTSRTIIRSPPSRGNESQRCPGQGNDTSLGLLGSAYLNSTRSTESSLGVMQFSNDSASCSSLGLLGTQQYDGNFSAGGSPGVCAQRPKNTNRTPQPATCPGPSNRTVREISTTRVGPPEPQPNITEDIHRQLNILETHERNQIQRDLANYQSARRTLVTNTTKAFGDTKTKKNCPSPHPHDDCS